MVCAFRLHLGCVRACVCTCSHFSLSAWQTTCTLFRLTPCHPSLSMRSVCGPHQVCPSPLRLAYRGCHLKQSSKKCCEKSHRTEKIRGHFFTFNSPGSLSGVYAGHLLVSRRAIWDSWEHVVWWRELENECRKHLSLFLLFCPIFLLLESGRVCKSHSFCPRPYVCTAAVVTVALFSVLQLVRSYRCVYMSVALFMRPNVHAPPVSASNHMSMEKFPFI